MVAFERWFPKTFSLRPKMFRETNKVENPVLSKLYTENCYFWNARLSPWPLNFFSLRLKMFRETNKVENPCLKQIQ